MKRVVSSTYRDSTEGRMSVYRGNSQGERDLSTRMCEHHAELRGSERVHVTGRYIHTEFRTTCTYYGCQHIKSQLLARSNPWQGIFYGHLPCKGLLLPVTAHFTIANLTSAGGEAGLTFVVQSTQKNEPYSASVCRCDLISS